MKNTARRMADTSSRSTRERPAQKSRRHYSAPEKPDLNQEKIDRAREIFGVKTETEAIDLALDAANDLALFRAEVEAGFKHLLGKGGFTDHFPH